MHNDTVFTSNFSQPVVINRTRLGHLIALAGVLLLAVFLHFYRLEQEGYANLYYAAAVKSMLTSWHNFFFVSFDSGGFVTVDKPPLGLWIQAASAWAFGFSGWSLLLPQALAGVLSVAVLYHLVQRTFGRPAGLLAALLLTLTPISIAANRNNTMDSQLVLVVLLAAWAMMLAAEKGKLRWLLVSMFLVGVGFNIKMLQAFLVLPALYLLYFVAAPRSWWQKIWHLGAGTAVLLIVSLSWAVVVDAIPASERPFIGSSQNNTVMELITGHNGGARLFAGGPNGGPGGQGPANGQPPNFPPADGNLSGNLPGNMPGNPPNDDNAQPNNPPGLAGGSETGDTGIGRLFNQQLAGQISWFLPLAFFSFAVVFVGGGLRWPLDARQHQVLFWLAWLLPMVIFFSFAGLFHRYYLEMLAPAIATLTAVGLLALWQKYNQPGWQGWLLPLGIAGTVATHAFIIAAFPEWSQWLTPIVVVGGWGTAVLLLGIRYWVLKAHSPNLQSPISNILFVAALAPLLLSPAIWSYTPIWFGGDTGLPYAGPELQRGRPFTPSINAPIANTALIPGLNRELLTYLTEHYQGETFLVAGSNARTVAPYILATDYAAMAMGGFSGGDNILTADSLSQLVANDEVRFFLVSEQNGPGGGPNGRGNNLTTWITQNCTAVSQQTTTPAPNNNGPRPAEAPQQLFDCQS